MARRMLPLAMLVVTLAGCASPPAPTALPSPSGPAEPGPSSASTYGRLFQRVSENGGVATRDVALQAFSLAIAPLPGVTLPTGDQAQPYERADGTFAIEWIRPYLATLTPEQLKAYNAAVTPDPSATVFGPDTATGTAALAGFAIPAATEKELYEKSLLDAKSLIAAKLHRKLRMSWSVTLDNATRRDENELAVTFSLPTVIPGVQTCNVFVQPAFRGTESPRAFGQVELDALMAHEMFHCFQFDLLGSNTTGVDAWLLEGQAEWVGENLKGPSIFGWGWWVTYLNSPGLSLFSRNYDALGYYLHMQEVDIDPWLHLDEMLLVRNNVDAFKKAGTTDDRFLDTWASGMLRDSTLGPAWVAKGPWTTVQHAPAVPVQVPAIGSLAVGTDPLTMAQLRVNSSADIVETEVKGHTRLSAAGVDSVGLSGGWLCTKLGGCACPAGMIYGGPPLEDAGPTFTVAITGSLDGVRGTLVGHALSEFCRPDTSPSPRGSGTAGGGSPACPRGCAGSTGEPHLRTVDGIAYDFQAAGEYVLLRSPDATIEIQARAEPRGVGADFTVNTAVATRVNGHRVTVTLVEHLLEARVDGQVAGLTAPTDLGAGGRVVRYASGIEIDFPDGSRVYALARSPCCMNIVVSPSDALRAAARGLLGEVAAAGLPVPALPDGSRLPRAETAHDRFVAIYERLGPAWLVTDATTLFDYAPGKTTASYVVRGFPAEARTRTVEDLTGAERATAAPICAPVTDPDLFLNCMFDVTLSDLEQWAELYVLTERLIKGGTDVLNETRPDPDALPAGFVELLPDVRAVLGGAIGPDQVVYLSVQESSNRYAVLAVDLPTGTIRARLDVTGGGRIALAEGRVWVGGLAAGGGCSVTALDPATLAPGVSAAVPCDGFGSTFAAFDDAIWFLDRTTSDADGHGGRLRRIDPLSGAISGDVVVGFVNGQLFATPDALFWLGQPSLSSRPEDAALYRLLPGDAVLTSLGPVDTAGLYPAADGVWAAAARGNAAEFRSSLSGVTRTIPIDGTLVGADENGLYVNRTSAFDGVAELWRYPVDGQPPERLAAGTTLQTATGDRILAFAGSEPLLVGNGFVVKLWLIPGRIDPARDPLVMQAAPIP